MDVTGFSHTIEMPASRKAFAISKWLSFGVAMTTTSQPSSRADSAAAICAWSS